MEWWGDFVWMLAYKQNHSIITPTTIVATGKTGFSWFSSWHRNLLASPIFSPLFVLRWAIWSQKTTPNEVLMLIFWKTFEYRKWMKLHQNTRLMPVFEPKKGGFMMKSVTIHSLCVLTVMFSYCYILLFYSLLYKN